MKKISVIIPCYNEEKGVGKVIDGVPVEKLLGMGYETEIIVVDNNSKDKTTEVAKAHGATVFSEMKQGKGHALVTGFKNVSGDTDYIVMLDGDNTYRPDEIPRLIEPLNSDFCDVIIGSRLEGKLNGSSLSTSHRLANWFFTFFVRTFYLANTTDTCTGYFAWKKHVIDGLVPHIKSSGFAIEAEMITKMARLGYQIYSVPITYDRREGESKLSPILDGIKITLMLFRNIGWKAKKTINYIYNDSATKLIEDRVKKIDVTKRPIINNSNITASVIIPTLNCATTVRKVLDGVLSQNYSSFETIVVDLGSTDETLNIVKEYPVNIVNASASEMGHGRTRNFGAEIANGGYIVFLSHDAVPESKTWLEEIIKPFNNVKIGAVYGRQLPTDDAKTIDKLFCHILYGDKQIVWSHGTYTQGDNIFSDANSAVRRKLLIDNPYKNDIIVSEDYEWATRIMKLGNFVVYNPKAEVIHSHSYNLISLFKRNFDIGVSYKFIDDFQNSKAFISKGMKVFANEVSLVLKDKKLYLLPSIFIRDVIRFIAINLGKHESIIPKEFKKKYLSDQGWYWR